MIKLIHLSDLHIGKRLSEISLLGEQQYILNEILSIVGREKPDGVIIAGDVYDKSIPSAEAIRLLDDFIFDLSRLTGEVFIISGNHDSPERLSFGNRLMSKSGVHISSAYNGQVERFRLSDKEGGGEKGADIYLLPYIKPQNVRPYFKDTVIETYTDAVRTALSQVTLDRERTNVLVTHQFVTGGTRSESEELSIGGSDNVDSSAFEGFDYVALGHLHGPQKVQLDSGIARYCGTPLKYSFSEVNHKKSVTVVEIEGKSIETRQVELKPKHDMREIKGRYNDIVLRKNYENTDIEDYLRIILTDEEDVMDAMSRLRAIYPNLMRIDYDNARTRTTKDILSMQQAKSASPTEIFEEFFRSVNNGDMTQEQREVVEKLVKDIWEGNYEAD